MCMKIWGDSRGREGHSVPHTTTSDEHSRYQPGTTETSTLFSPHK